MCGKGEGGVEHRSQEEVLGGREGGREKEWKQGHKRLLCAWGGGGAVMRMVCRKGRVEGRV